MTLIAKPIIKDQLWVVTDGFKKVGNIESENGQYKLKLGDNVTIFDSTKKIAKVGNIQFDTSKVKFHAHETLPYAIWPLDCNNTYNNMVDVVRQLHVFTKEADSKCYYAAGYYALKQADEYEVILCPKYIFIQRYPYMGPFKTQDEAIQAVNTK